MNDRFAVLPRFSGLCRRNHRAFALALLALGSQVGCGREFYREWANQDVSEAVFEKSRDPRWRLDQFSIDPPAMARFADPYDPDRPPAPPDDFPTQSLSPVPQWPDHRLQMPVEGTGYLKLLDDGPRYESPPPVAPRNPDEKKRINLPPTSNPPQLPPTGTSPFTPGGTTPPAGGPTPGDRPPGTTDANGPAMSLHNPGPRRDALSPTSLAANAVPPPSTPRTTRPGSTPGAGGIKDDGVKRVAMPQEPARTMPTQTVPISPLTPPPSTTTAPGDLLRTPQIGQDPLPTDDNLRTPRRVRPDLTPEEYRQSEEKASDLAGLFVPQNVPFDEAVAAGLKIGTKPYVLTMEKAFQIGIVNSRTYQTQLENVYLNALPVTLQRFSFQPQFIAGLSPLTGAGGFGSVQGAIGPAVSPVNSFLYNTRASGNQLSVLNVGTVAGVGKLLDNGTRILASFANSLVFNFVGRNPAQPSVRSFLPIQAVVPFLRGGGRAVTLEGLTQAERTLLYSIRLFAKFRQEFVVATLVNNNIPSFGVSTLTGSFTVGGNIDPTTGFLNVVEDVQLVENYVKNLAVFERFAEVYKELVNGEGSGLSQLQVDQLSQQVEQARIQLLGSRLTYRNDLDSYKIQLGMPPDVPMVIDRSRTLGFKQIFEEIDRWSLSPRRELTDLDEIVSRLPRLQNLIIDGRSCLDIFSQKDDQNLENLLLIAERIALENRLDLMNARAQLYDQWRQIRVSANALKGIFNVSVTNQFVTPPTTNNPFGFLDQAKQFSLVLNAELPLVRLAERNNFRLQLINYERQRRTLQNTEDFIKYQLRQEMRAMQLQYQQYLIFERNLVLTVSQKDQAFEQIIAPPQGANAGNQAPTQTLNLINAQAGVISNENSLVTAWYQYQVQRLGLYRDLGILPFDEWEAFDELFPTSQSGRLGDTASDRGRQPAPARANNRGGRAPEGLGTPIPVTPAASNPGGR